MAATGLTADDWIDAARHAVAESGIGALAVEPLAKTLGVTKGSFYWHFANRDALLDAVLKRWEHDSTEPEVAATQGMDDPRDRLARLIEDAFSDIDSTDRAIHRALLNAGGHPLVETVLNRVTARRLDYIESCYRQLGCDARTARLWTLQAYATYLGTLQFRHDLPRFARSLDAAYRRHLINTLIPPPGRTVPHR